MKSKILHVAKFLFFLFLGILLLIYAFRDIHFSDLWEGLKKTRLLWVFLALLIGGISHVSRAYRWILLIKHLGYNPSVKNTFYALMAGYLANLALPRLGEITRCGSLHKTDKIPVDSLLGTVIAERMSDLIVLVLLILSVFLLKMRFFGDFLNQHIFFPFLDKFETFFGLPAFLWIVLVLLLVAAYLIYRLLRERLMKYLFFRRVSAIKNNLIKGLKSIFLMPDKGLFLFHTAIIWIMYFLMTYLIFFALGSTSVLSPLDALFIMTIGSIGMTAPVQGGIGAYHWIVSSGLTLYGITREEGLVFATVAHGSQTLMVILLGAISFFLIFLTAKRLERSG